MRGLCIFLAACSLSYAEIPALIPMPRKVVAGSDALVLPAEPGISVEEEGDALRLVEVLRGAGLKPKRAQGDAAVRVVRGKVENPHRFPGAYRLEVAVAGITITSADAAGAFYAAETLRQLMTVKDGKVTAPKVAIEDWPAFRVRGFMLDVGRNYQSPALVKEQIEVMARYKLNVFHFHFTDNPGWRLESRVHPKVTDAPSMSRQPGKFYTQAEFKDILAFCKARHITVIPEMDMPGHSVAFRKALGITRMNDPATRRILKDLLTELASLAPAEEMPWIHLGTDEVHGKEETVDATFLPEMAAHVRSLGRRVIGWKPGIEDKTDVERVAHLWASTTIPPRNPFIDSRSTYLNHMDPFEMVSTLLFQQSCRVPFGNGRALGGILCSWPDIRIENERDQLKQNPVYPGIVTYGESMWRGVETDDKMAYWANLPAPGTPEFGRLEEFEGRLLEHKARFFTGKEFPYVKQSGLRWRLIGPFPHGGEVAKGFPIEDELRESYEFDGKTYRWSEREFAGATVYLRHFFGFPSPVKEQEGTCYALTQVWSPKDQDMPVWLGFHGISRSDRRGITKLVKGEWFPAKGMAWVNGREIAPPEWAGRTSGWTAETPFTNEDYFFREPTVIRLKSGWNRVLLKVPHRKADWKWMFTFIPVGDATGLRYSSEIDPK